MHTTVTIPQCLKINKKFAGALNNLGAKFQFFWLGWLG